MTVRALERVHRLLLLGALLSVAAPVAAQAPDPGAAAQAPAATASAPVREESAQNLITLPVTQPMRRFGHHFRITHRFARDLRRGGFGELASDLFGLDNGAIIGLDYRFAPLSRTQVGVYRSMLSRTLQFSGRYDAIAQERSPIGLSFLASVEGVNNFRDDHSPVVGVVASRTYGGTVALYASPTFVWHSVTPGGDAHAGHDHEHEEGTEVAPAAATDENTMYVGLGTRVRLPKSSYVVLEFTPRVSGFAPGRGVWGAAFEKQTRGHLFQINLSNSFGTTYGQLARGGERSQIYLGFNLARRF